MTLKPFFTKQNLIYLALGLILLFSFFAFTLLVRTDALRPFDFNTTVKLQAKIPLRLDSFFSLLSVVGRFEYTGSLLFIILAVFGIIKKKVLVTIPFILFALAHVVELIGKNMLNQPGPPKMFLRSQFGEFPGLHVFTDASYPSGHALRIVFLVVLFLFLIYKSKLSLPIKLCSYVPILSILLLMLVSRVSLGEHWTTDVIGGSILGLALSLFSLPFLSEKR